MNEWMDKPQAEAGRARQQQQENVLTFFPLPSFIHLSS